MRAKLSMVSPGRNASFEITPRSGRGLTSVRGRLRAATAEQHAMLERRLPLWGELGASRYLHLLGAFRGFYAPLERHLAAVLNEPAPVELARTGWLDEDLTGTGLRPADIAALPSCSRLPAAGDVAHALGCCYVLEGAALGGKVIAARLSAAAGWTPRLRFFTGHGSATGHRWGAFLAHLEEHCSDAAALARAQMSAVATFECFENWLHARQVLR